MTSTLDAMERRVAIVTPCSPDRSVVPAVLFLAFTDDLSNQELFSFLQGSWFAFLNKEASVAECCRSRVRNAKEADLRTRAPQYWTGAKLCMVPYRIR